MGTDCTCTFHAQTFQEHVQSFYCHELNDLFLSPDRVTTLLNSKSAVHHIEVPAFATTVLIALFGQGLTLEDNMAIVQVCMSYNMYM